MAEVDLPDIGVGLVDALRADSRFQEPGRVQRGRFAIPPVRPFACVSVPGMQSEQGPTMGKYTRTLVYDIMAWDCPPTVTTHDASVAAEALAHAVHSALETARLSPASPLYRLREFSVRTATLIGGEAHIPAGEVFAICVVECKFVRRTGLVDRSAP